MTMPPILLSPIDELAAFFPQGDAHWIAPRIWQGSFPAPGTDLRAQGIDVVILCARELNERLDRIGRPVPSLYPGVRVLRAYLDDSGAPATLAEFREAHRVADEAAALWLRGARILVTCAMGLNRSGLVTAILLRELFGVDGVYAIDHIRRRRPNAMGNRYFQDYLRRLGPLPHPHYRPAWGRPHVPHHVPHGPHRP